MKYRFWLIFVAAILIFAGCSINSADSEPTSLWVLTEKSVTDGMNYQIEAVRQQFSTVHPHVTVKIDYLPTDPDEREQYIQELKKDIADGTAPDLYLLPTSNVLVLDEPSKYTYVPIEPFFRDVAYEMHNGRFFDISAFYNKDKELGKEALLESVMDAGTVGSERYIIPLRFTMPVVYLTGEQATPLESTRIEDLMRSAIESQNSALAKGISNYGSVNVFSDVIDYQNKQINLTKKQLTEYLSLNRDLCSLPDSYSPNSRVLFSNIEGLIKQTPIRISTIESYLTYNAYAQYKKIPLEVQPLETMDGHTVASITYWGAVDASSQNPQMAYEFLSRFLSEELQWEQTRPTPAEWQYSGLIAESWPVRARNAAEHLWPNFRDQETKFNPYTSVEIQEDQISALFDSIDFARFLTGKDFDVLLSNAQLTEDSAKIDTLSADYLHELTTLYPDYQVIDID